jgi:transcriptional regulator with XRE-family HTH domain
MKIAEQLGGAIRAMREERGLNAVSLAAKIKKKPGVLSAWETGKSVPDLVNLLKVSAALDVPLPDILQRAEIAQPGQSTPPAPALRLSGPLNPLAAEPALQKAWVLVMKVWKRKKERPGDWAALITILRLLAGEDSDSAAQSR